MSNILLEIKNLSKKYNNKEVVSIESFKLLEGDILGFIGANGAGKSTSINMLTTIVSPDSGSIYYKGKDIKNQQNIFKSSLGVVPQELAIYEDLSAYDNVKFFCSLYGFKGNELKERTKDALEFVGLWERHKEFPSKFSGGMKRRLNIACAIAHSPKILIMDEPTVGIDPQSRNKILEVIKCINTNGTTVIYTSHYMEEIETLCNRIALIDKGIIIEDLDKSLYKNKYLEFGCKTLEDIFLYLTGTDLRDLEE
ncbi:ABC transporter ATP-binding protein [Clostridioides difficile]|nr:ATP-binding cassette domain-containing protein [Clostridioides difficile]EGT4668687.1 ABC transporter ATP-binding protein [Clostridioides difficile]